MSLGAAVAYAQEAINKRKRTLNVNSRAFTFTDYSLREENWKLAYANLGTEYIIFGRELCPTTKRPHLQGFISFKEEKAFSTVDKISPGAHIEIARKCAAANFTYCSKDENYFEAGKKPPGPGSRSDLKTLVKRLRAGASDDDIIDEFPGDAMRYNKSFSFVRKSLKTPGREPPIVKWFYGATETGKTRTAIAEAGEYFYKKRPGKWWEKYGGQKHVILDELRPVDFPFHELLLVLDRYPHIVEYKGGSEYLQATHIWITCPEHPEVLFKDVGENIRQLTRRIHEIRFFGPPPLSGDDLSSKNHPPEVTCNTKVTSGGPGFAQESSHEL